MNYNPIEFWKEQGLTYYDNFRYTPEFTLQEAMIREYLYGLEFESVLEVGCGFGRVTNIILDGEQEIDRYIAIDVSKDQIANARKYLRTRGASKKVKFVLSDIQSADFGIFGKFDLVIAVEVLMHIPPTEIDSVLWKLISLSEKHVINVDWYEDERGQDGESIFRHSYPLLYRKHILGGATRVPIKNDKINVRQSLFHVKI